MEAARVFAENALSKGGSSFDRQLNWIFSQALDRAPSARSGDILADLYRDNLKRFTASPEDAQEVCQRGRFAGAGTAKVPRTGGGDHGHARGSESARNDHQELRD